MLAMCRKCRNIISWQPAQMYLYFRKSLPGRYPKYILFPGFLTRKWYRKKITGIVKILSFCPGLKH